MQVNWCLRVVFEGDRNGVLAASGSPRQVGAMRTAAGQHGGEWSRAVERSIDRAGYTAVVVGDGTVRASGGRLCQRDRNGAVTRRRSSGAAQTGLGRNLQDAWLRLPDAAAACCSTVNAVRMIKSMCTAVSFSLCERKLPPSRSSIAHGAALQHDLSPGKRAANRPNRSSKNTHTGIRLQRCNLKEQ